MTRSRIYEILEATSRQNALSYSFDALLITLVAINLIALVLETVDSLRMQFGELFWIIEVATVLAFTFRASCPARGLFEYTRGHPGLGLSRTNPGPARATEQTLPAFRGAIRGTE